MIAKLGLASAGFVLLLCATFSLSQAAEDKQQEFAAHMQKAHGYLDQKQPALAIPEFQAAVAIDPENVDAQANLGVLLFFQGKAADSIPHFRAALAAVKEERSPGLAKIQGLLGMAESRTLDFADARKDMEAAFPALQDPRFQVQLGLELVGLDTESGDLDKAACRARAVAEEPTPTIRRCSMPPIAPIPIWPASRCSRCRWLRRTPRKCISCWPTKTPGRETPTARSRNIARQLPSIRIFRAFISNWRNCFIPRRTKP